MFIEVVSGGEHLIWFDSLCRKHDGQGDRIERIISTKCPIVVHSHIVRTILRFMVTAGQRLVDDLGLVEPSASRSGLPHPLGAGQVDYCGAQTSLRCTNNINVNAIAQKLDSIIA